MNNLEILKQTLHADKDGVIISFFNVAIDNIDSLTPNQVADIIDGDCNICLCYGCRQFTRNCKEHITKDECKKFIIDYFSRDYNPYVDDCQCPSCRTRRGEDTDKHYWKLSYKNKGCVIYETSLPEAKSLAINKGIYNKEDYPYIVGKINDEVKKEKEKMKKVMISQPIENKTQEEIFTQWKESKEKLIAKGYKVINLPTPTEKWVLEQLEVKNNDLFYIGKYLENMSQCDAIYFCEGWALSKVCRIERLASVLYGLEILEKDEEIN